MAEYCISYKDLVSLIETWTDSVPEEELTQLHKSEILAAITCNLDINENSIPNIVSWWKNTISERSQLVLGSKYISIQDTMLIFIEHAIVSGVFESIILSVMTGVPLSTPITVGSNIAFAIYKWLKSINSLDDSDFCVYIQARMHWCQKKPFTEKDLCDWFPEKGGCCNAYNKKWDCTHFKNSRCDMQDAIHDSLKSLVKKHILLHDEKSQQYRFKW